MERWNYKLKPNKKQVALLSEWLITLRKHRNYCLRERENGWNTNNKDAETEVSYAFGAEMLNPDISDPKNRYTTPITQQVSSTED
jgi:transposase